MKRIHLVVIASALVFLLGLTACAPGWGQPGGGGMMGGEGGGMMGGEGGGMMGGEGGGMMGGEGGGMMGGEGGGMMGGEGGGMMGGEGGGMMGGEGGGMMGGQDGQGDMMGSGMMSVMPMMGGMTGYYSGIPTPLSHDDAKAIADNYLASLNTPNLEIDEFEEYSHNLYLSLIEKSTGKGAIEVIIDRYSGSLQPEPQSMMWNKKYGMMGGASQPAQMTVTPERALRIAQDFLDVVYPGTRADEIVAYYGYYTIMTTLEDEHYGMLSVNGSSAEIWYHAWHGMFISELEEHS